MSEARNHSSGAIAWASVETLLRQGSQFAAGVVLARLLTPSDFGLMAMLTIFTAFATLLVNSGFASALIQQREESNTDSSTVFWFNIGSGTVMALLLVAAAPLIARFYGHSELIALTWAMALNVWLVSWMTVHVALLTRHMEFRTQAKASGVSNLTGAAVAIALAMHGAGVWALAVQILLATSLNVLLLWWLHPWRPSATFSIASIRRLFGFGGFMLASLLIDAISTRLYSVLIGRMYSSRDLGLYTRATTTLEFSQGTLGTIFSRVALPVLSRHAGMPDALRMRLKAGNQLIMAVSLPAMLGLGAVADVAVPTLFGHQWSGSIPLMQILCLSGAIWPLQVSNVQVLVAQGHSRLLFRLEIVKKSVLVISVLIASHWGMQAIAWASVFSSLFAFLVNSHYTRTLIDYGPVKQLRDISGYLALAASMAIIVVLFGHTIAWLTPGKRLLAEMIVGAAFYIGVAALFRLPAIGYAFEVLRSLRAKRPDDAS